MSFLAEIAVIHCCRPTWCVWRHHYLGRYFLSRPTSQETGWKSISGNDLGPQLFTVEWTLNLNSIKLEKIQYSKSRLQNATVHWIQEVRDTTYNYLMLHQLHWYGGLAELPRRTSCVENIMRHFLLFVHRRIMDLGGSLRPTAVWWTVLR